MRKVKIYHSFLTFEKKSTFHLEQVSFLFCLLSKRNYSKRALYPIAIDDDYLNI